MALRVVLEKNEEKYNKLSLNAHSRLCRVLLSRGVIYGW